MKLILTITLIIGQLFLSAQENRLNEIRANLIELSFTQTGLTQEVEISVSDISIKEFIGAIAKAHKLNVSVNSGVDAELTNDFSNANVMDVFVYVCKEYELDIDVIGGIISFVPYKKPVSIPAPVKARKLKITFNQSTQFLSVDLKKDTLAEVAREISKISGLNVILAPGIDDQLISGFIQNRPIRNTIEKLAFANGLSIEKSSENFIVLSQGDPLVQQNSQRKKTNKRGDQNSGNENFELIIEDQLISVTASNSPINEILKSVSDELGVNYFIFDEPTGNTTLFIEGASYNSFMTYLLNGTEFTHKKENSVYLIGKRQTEKLRMTELFQLQNRTVETVIDAIPGEIKKGLEIKEFIELNSLVITGSYPNLKEVKEFLYKIDKIVPVVLIDVLIVNVSNSIGISTGVSAGFGENPNPAGNQVLPDFSADINPNKLLDLISGLTGAGALNLGKVTPEFYLSIKALEQNGKLKTKSTPKLATINGHEANTTIGTTEYYLETSNNVIGTQNPQNIQTRRYQSVSADLSITIKPIVSGDEQVTLSIEVSQSDFTEKFEPGAPPGSVSRTFNSVIRVRNEEMILLGGLEEKSVSETGRGVPFLSRVPVLKHLFGDQERSKSKTKLNIFIKPTIIY